MTSRAYGARSPRSHYDVILIVTSFATELATPTVTYVSTYGHLTAFNIQRYLDITAIGRLFIIMWIFAVDRHYPRYDVFTLDFPTYLLAGVQHVFTRSLAVHRRQLLADVFSARPAAFPHLRRTNVRVSRPTLYIRACRGAFCEHLIVTDESR